MAYQNQFQKGEDVIFELKNSNGFDLNNVWPASGTGTAKFVVHLYPDGLDLSVEENKKKIQVIKYNQKDRQVGTVYYGYVEPVNSGTSQNPNYTSAVCILPWQITKDIQAGSYTMTIIWEENGNRTIMMNNSIIIMIEGSGEYTDSDMDINIS